MPSKFLSLKESKILVLRRHGVPEAGDAAWKQKSSYEKRIFTSSWEGGKDFAIIFSLLFSNVLQKESTETLITLSDHNKFQVKYSDADEIQRRQRRSDRVCLEIEVSINLSAYCYELIEQSSYIKLKYQICINASPWL